jgi:hypothetical protein
MMNSAFYEKKTDCLHASSKWYLYAFNNAQKSFDRCHQSISGNEVQRTGRMINPQNDFVISFCEILIRR